MSEGKQECELDMFDFEAAREEVKGFWYPQFRLRENPFIYADRALEKHYSVDIRLIPTATSRAVLDYVRSHSNVIFEGPKGCGKSSALEVAYEQIPADAEYPCYIATGSRSLKDIYESLWGDVYDMPSYSEMFDKIWSFRSDWIDRDYRSESVLRCAYPLCSRRKRCVLSIDGGYTLKTLIDRMPMNSHCSLKEWVTIQLHEIVANEYKRPVFLLDVPDDIIEVRTSFFSKFVIDLLKATKGSVILMATSDQYLRLYRNEAMSRMQHVELPLPTKEEMKQIFYGRLKDADRHPLDKDAVNYLIEASGHNTRKFIRMCSKVLVEMEGKDQARNYELC